MESNIAPTTKVYNLKGKAIVSGQIRKKAILRMM
jgi:hypothetical protein